MSYCLPLVIILLLLIPTQLPAAPLPSPEIPLAGVYTSWLLDHNYAQEGWIRGMHSRHWLPRSAQPGPWGQYEYYRDQVVILPESDLVLWVRRPAVLDHLSPLAEGKDGYGNLVQAGWPGVQRREVMTRDQFLTRTIARSREDLLLRKIAEMRRTIAQGGGREAWFDLNIPINLPKSIERVVGKGQESNITVTGRESITMSGESTHTNQFQTDETGRGQPLFPRLEMKQELQVKMNGTVGEKIHVEVENNSVAQGLEGNTIRVRYEGDEDEVIQRIEMGDTKLTLPGSGLIGSYSTTTSGLFGIMVMGKLGALDFTAIASKQEAEVADKTFNNSGQVSQGGMVLDTGFLANRFFYLDKPDSANTHPDSLTFYKYKVDEGTLNVFVANHSTIPDQYHEEYRGIAFNSRSNSDTLDIDPTDLSNLGGERGNPFRLLKPGSSGDYIVRKDINGNLLFIQLNFPIGRNDILAVSYQGISSDGDVIDVGTTDLQSGEFGWESNSDWSQDTHDYLQLELIKPEEFSPESKTWDYMLRNIYSLGGRNIDYNSLEVEIHRNGPRLPADLAPDGTTPYLRIFGLDQFGSSNLNFGHDNKIDRVWVDEAQGLLLFPGLTPFDPDTSRVRGWTTTVQGDNSLGYELPYDDDDRNPKLYNMTHDNLIDSNSNSVFQIHYKSNTVSSRFALNAFNILEGSEVVTVDGNRLNRGTDYRIDYFSGEVELLGERASLLTPTSQIQITYQYKPFVGGGKSSLVGLHGTYHLGEKNRLSSSWLYESQYTGARRPRPGEESTRMVVGNLLGNFSANPDFLTKMVNYLPRVDTDAASSVTLSGEIAMSLPNPNIDNVAYLDDMEGAEDADELSINRANWVLASEPFDKIRRWGAGDIDILPANRAKGVYWFTPDERPHRYDFNIDLPEQEANEVLDVLHVEIPVNLGQTVLAEDNLSVDLTQINADNEAKGDALWMGLMQSFGGDGLDLSKAEYIEIWVNDFKQDVNSRQGRIHFDLGQLSEDYWEPEKNELNTEDNVQPYGVFTIAKDTGLDNELLEESNTDDNGELYPYSRPEDMAGDNLNPELKINGQHYWANGLEGNRRLDSEDLDFDGQLDQNNSYFTLDFSLADEAVVDMVPIYATDTKYDHGNKAWRLYRLNLDQARICSDTGAMPNWSRIKYFRFWVDGLNQEGRPLNKLEIASIKIVGNRWRAQGIQEIETGRTLDVSELGSAEDLRAEVINSKDHANFYWPFEERIDPESGLPEREQALNFVYEDLAPGHQAVLRKEYRALNLTGYKNISFFVHPDEATVDNTIFLRAALDSVHYYEIEYRPSRSDWAEISFSLQDWVNLKLDVTADTSTAVIADLKEPNRSYTVRRVGSPTLKDVKVIYFGVANNSPDETLRGETWFNDIRVLEVRRDVGFGGNVRASVNMANSVIQISGDYRETDAEFRGLHSSAGSGTNQRQLNTSIQSAVQHLIPTLGFTVPVSASFSTSRSTPKYITGSDVLLASESLRDQNSTETVNQSFGVSISKTPSVHWLGRYFFDNLKLNGSLSQFRTRGPLMAKLEEKVSYKVSYNTKFKERKVPIPFSEGLRWVPNSLSLSTSTNRSWSNNWTTSGLGRGFKQSTTSPTGQISNEARLNWTPMKSMITNASLTDTRNLEHQDAKYVTVAGTPLNLGFQTRQGQSTTIDYTVPFIPRFKPRISFTSSYSQDNQPYSTGGQFQQGVKTVNNSNNVSSGYNFKIGKYFKKLGGKHLTQKGKPGRQGSEGVQPPPSTQQRRARRILVPVDPLRGPDPRALKRTSRNWFPETTPLVTETVAAPVDSVSSGRPDPMIIVWKTLGILADLQDLKVDLSRRVNTGFIGVAGAADMLYRFGLSENPDMMEFVAEDSLVQRKIPDRRDESRTLKLSTGVTIADHLRITTNFSETRTDNQSKSGIGQTHTIKTTRSWPNVNLNLEQVEKWPIWGNLFESSSMGISYAKDLNKTHNLRQDITDRNENSSFGPHWQIVWRNKVRSNLTGSVSNSWKYNNAQTTRTSKLNVGFDLSYNLSAPNGIKIPIFPRIRFNSRLDLDLKTSYSRSSTAQVEKTGFERDLTGNSSLSISPGANYQFHEKLTGSAHLRFSRTKRDQTGEVIKTVGLTVSTTLIF